MKQSTALKYARIKLSQRQVKEWETLANIQQKVWRLVRQETDLKLVFSTTDKKAIYKLRVNQFIQLERIMIKQRHDRERMKAKHQEENTLLNELYLEPE